MNNDRLSEAAMHDYVLALPKIKFKTFAAAEGGTSVTVRRNPISGASLTEGSEIAITNPDGEVLAIATITNTWRGCFNNVPARLVENNTDAEYSGFGGLYSAMVGFYGSGFTVDDQVTAIEFMVRQSLAPLEPEETVEGARDQPVVPTEQITQQARERRPVTHKEIFEEVASLVTGGQTIEGATVVVADRLGLTVQSVRDVYEQVTALANAES